MRRAALTLAAVAALYGAPAAAQYNSNTAMDALFLCKASYCNDAPLQSWSCGPTCDALGSMSSITVSDNGTYDSQGFVGMWDTYGQIVVGFRGTHNIQNWIQDLTFGKVAYTNANCSGCEVHHGFLEEWQSYNTQILGAVSALLQSNPSAPIFVTGHSLGAAVSLLAALDIINVLGVPSAQVTLYNFGEPRLGNPAFAAWASSQLNYGKQFRVTHKRDPVPHVPPEAFGFLHTPHELWYDNDGNTTWTDCVDSATAEDPSCSDSVLPIDVDDHLLYLGVCTECTCSGDADARALVAAASRAAMAHRGIRHHAHRPLVHHGRAGNAAQTTHKASAKARHQQRSAGRKHSVDRAKMRDILRKKLSARPDQPTA